MVGVAFAGLDEADNIGYVIPMPVIQLFLTTFESQGTFGQLPRLGLRVQNLENRVMREVLRLDADGRYGQLVRQVLGAISLIKWFYHLSALAS